MLGLNSLLGFATITNLLVNLAQFPEDHYELSLSLVWHIGFPMLLLRYSHLRNMHSLTQPVECTVKILIRQKSETCSTAQERMATESSGERHQ